MPQFDPSTFISQLFWFSVCFTSLYFFIKKVFLPRVEEIIKERELVIAADSEELKNVQSQIDKTNATSDLLRKTAVETYKSTIDQGIKNAKEHREGRMLELKNTIENMVEVNIKNISDFNKDCQEKNTKTIQILTKKIENKLF